MKWYKIHIPKHLIGGSTFWSIHRLYADVSLALPLQMENTLLLSTKSDFENYHYYLYINPDDDILLPIFANYFNAIPCDPPRKEEVGFNGGNIKLWAMLM